MKLLIVLVVLSALLVLSGHAANTRFAVIGDYGYVGPADSSVAAMIHSWNVDFIVTVGDNSYNPGTIDDNVGRYYSDFIGSYIGAYGPGSPVNRFFPSLGNHEYSDGGRLPAYLSYFNLPGDGIHSSSSSSNERYYDFEIGNIQFLALNANYQEPDGNTWQSAQGSWARDLLTNYGKNMTWKVILMHQAPYSSCNVHGSTPSSQWPFEQWGADVVLAGHDHSYERIMVDQDHEGDSIPYFVNGVGGRSLYGFPSSGFVPGSAARYSSNYGAILAEANDTTMTFRFYSIANGGTLVDSITAHARSGCCRGKTGNIDQLGIADLTDLSDLVSYLTEGGWIPVCPQEADLNNSGLVDLDDLTALVYYLTGAGFSLPNCR
jgi:tartrate-resistant acid phosphatase type 5